MKKILTTLAIVFAISLGFTSNVIAQSGGEYCNPLQESCDPWNKEVVETLDF